MCGRLGCLIVEVAPVAACSQCLAGLEIWVLGDKLAGG